jgi:protein TonB
VLSVTIARDGRLLNAVILSSSGYPEIDRGVVEGVRQGSPYTPLPDTIQGASATFRLPLISTRGP